MEIGIYSFVERTPDPRSGEVVAPDERMRDLLEEIQLADQVGLDVFGIGEHHRPEYLSSSPAVILAAAAARTRRIRLTSAVTVLSSDDPVRVFQDFATLDLLSGGRAEIMADRSSSRSRCSAMASRSTTPCSRRNSTCCWHCGERSA
jgi:alkanesulfonate monooxygenase SsuD/methylene tetrahydromethanopterin reductase-like flavin-dependent oxidoreductase (luciferase family)